MSPHARQTALVQWRTAILHGIVIEVRDAGRQFKLDQGKTSCIFAERDADVIRRKRIKACITNGAAKYAAAIQAAALSVVLVEEASEILEAHILTLLGP